MHPKTRIGSASDGQMGVWSKGSLVPLTKCPDNATMMVPMMMLVLPQYVLMEMLWQVHYVQKIRAGQGHKQKCVRCSVDVRFSDEALGDRSSCCSC